MQENRINIATTASDQTFHLVRTSIYSFLKTNSWFDGTIYLITHQFAPFTQRSIDLLSNIYSKLTILDLSTNRQINETFFLNIRRNNLLIHKTLETGIFLLPQKTIYFSNTAVFIKSIADLLSANRSLISGKPIDLLYLNDRLCQESLSQKIEESIFDSLDDPKICESHIFKKSSLYNDQKYKLFIMDLSSTYAVFFNTFENSQRYTRINQYWANYNQTSNNFSRRPINRKKVIASNQKIVSQADPTPVNLNIDISDISIIIPAYRAQDYIEECLDSIEKQGKNIEILVGIDNCQTTLDKLIQIKEKYSKLSIFFSEKKVGPYILRNSLAIHAKTNNLLFFDADDIMTNDSLSIILSYNNGSRPIRFSYFNFKDGENHLITNQKNQSVAHGVFFIPVKIFKSTGGFQSWEFAADTEFMKRCDANRILSLNLNQGLFYRRIHPMSLTQNSSTGYQSIQRKKIAERIRKTKKWPVTITPQLIELKKL
jgi:hypothetical protein